MRRLAAALLLALGAGACGGGSDRSAADASLVAPATRPVAIHRHADNGRLTLTIGSKNFTEQEVLGEIYAQALRAAGYSVRKALGLGDERAALRALKDGRISGYPEYTGTALLSLLDVPAGKVPSDKRRAYDEARAGMARQGVEAFAPTPFTSSNEVGLLRTTAEKLGVTRISDLRSKASRLDLYGPPECRVRRDCLVGLERVYGLRFRRFVAIGIGRRHQVLTSGRAKVSIVFSTDPQIRRDDEVVLDDDRTMFPPYNSTFLMKRSVARRAGPDLARTIAAVNRYLTADVMQELNARVDIDRDAPEQAAKAYLKQFNLVA